MKEAKKILFLCQYFYPETLSSAVLPYELATKFYEHGYTVSALVGYPNEYLKTEYNVPVKQNVQGINIERLKYTSANRHNKIGRVANFLSFSLKVMMHPKKIREADILICTTNPPFLPYIVALLTKLFHKKLITVLYDLYPDEPIKLRYLKEDSKVAAAFNIIYKTVFNNSYRIIAISSEMKKYLIKYKNVDGNKINVIQNWYRDCHQKLSYSIDLPLRILYGGNMGEAQDMETILDTAFRLRNDDRFKFIFVGQGSKKNQVKEYIVVNDLRNCELHDFLEKEKYDVLVESVSMTVLSLKPEIWGLGSPSKFYGYIAAKKPVIAIVPENTDIANDIKEYKNGIEVRNGDSATLVIELKKCVDNMHLLKKMSENSYELFLDKYTLERSYEKYRKIIEE